MAQLPDVFKADDHDEMKDFGLMPIGWYTGAFFKSELKKTKAGDGLRLNLQFKISYSNDHEDKYNKRIVFNGLNIQNPSEIAVRISQEELTSICKACDIDELEDSDEIHDIEIGVKIGIEKGQDGFEDKNKIKKYITMEEYANLDADK